jgi:hypothetical protein
MGELVLRSRSGDVIGYALLDDSDLEVHGQFVWHITTDGYAARNVKARNGRRTVLLHRAVMGVPYGDARQVDHKNRDRLDNRRGNLRIADFALNARNCGSRKGAASPWRGVQAHSSGRWQATVRLAGKLHYLGLYKNELDAAAAALAFRREHMPDVSEDPALVAAVQGRVGFS